MFYKNAFLLEKNKIADNATRAYEYSRYSRLVFCRKSKNSTDKDEKIYAAKRI